jgi:DNA (cytosine-5)-methyltransferase 1
MRHGSLFSGIGGFDLAAEWMGWENVFHCEWMEFPRKVLDYHFPNADSHIDICKTDFKKYANKIDILTGGFPCQPFSLAGKRKGTDDERYLWGEMLRAIQEIKPKYVIAENVFGITNIDGGLVFEQVCLDLETEGYEVQPFVIPAAAKNAPHRRDRCWFIAYNNKRNRQEIGFQTRRKEYLDGIKREQYAPDTKSNGSSIGKLGESQTKQQVQTGSDIDGFESLGNVTDTNRDGRGCLCRQQSKKPFETHPKPCDTCIQRNAADSGNKGLQRGKLNRASKRGKWHGDESYRATTKLSQISYWSNFPTQSPVCGGDDGIPTKLDGITFPKWRAESIKGYGNAIVPQIAYSLFEIIQELNENN